MTDHLHVIWRSHTTGDMFHVGHLTRSDAFAWETFRWVTEYRFWYVDDVTRPWSQGFRWMAAFPDKRPYVTRHLWPAFADRIPSPKRPDAAAAMRSWGLDPSERDPFTILAASRGRRVTDQIELHAAAWSSN